MTDSYKELNPFLGSDSETLDANKQALAKILAKIQALEDRLANGENVSLELKYEMSLIKAIKDEQHKRNLDGSKNV
jgi:hypothetical protein